MMETVEAKLRRQIAELEAKVADLRAERKVLRDIICARGPESKDTTEAEYLEMLHNHVPGSGLKFLAELGIDPFKKT
jgi:hypothetical protein